MRPTRKRIYCILVLVALIFQSFCLFYIANTYATSQKNKSKSIFPPASTPDNSKYYANIASPEIAEIEYQPENTPSGGEETPGDESVSEPSLADSSGESLEPEPDTHPENDNEPDNPIPEQQAVEHEPETDIEDDNPLSENIQPYDIEDSEDIEESEYDESDGDYYTEKDLLYSILLTMKINQCIALFVLAVALIIIVFKPIEKAYVGWHNLGKR